MAVVVVFLFIFSLFLSPASSVAVVYEYPMATHPTAPSVYLGLGPSYANEQLLGNFYVEVAGHPLNVVNGTPVYVNTTTSSGAVLEINDTSTNTVYLWINGTLPSGVTLCNGTSSILLSAYTLGNRISLKPGSPDMYLGFSVTALSKETGKIYLQYELPSGVMIVYAYPILINQ